MSLPIRRICAAFACLIAASWLRAAALPSPTGQSPFASVAALAATEHIPLQGFDTVRATQNLLPGDAVTVLFTLFDHGHAQQWLAEIKVVPLSEDERRAKPRQDVVYTGTGN